MTEHPTRFLWMRYLVGELNDPQNAQLESHLEGCQQCDALVEQLRGVQKAGRQIAPSLQLEPAKRLGWSRWLALPIAAAAAVLLLLVLRGPPKPPVSRPGVQAKGGARVSALCKVGERRWRCDSGETLTAGAGIRFSLELPSDRHVYVLILGVDATGQIQRYFPDDGSRARKLPPDEETLLPPDHSLVLDDQPGDERFFVLLSDQPFDASVARYRDDRLVIDAPIPIEQRSFVFRKSK